MSKRFFKYFLDVPTFMPEPSLLHTGPGPYGQSLSVHHWTEISISIPKIVTEIRTLNVPEDSNGHYCSPAGRVSDARPAIPLLRVAS